MDDRAVRNPEFFYGYVVVGASFFIMLLTFGSLYTFGVFFKPLLAEFGWTRAMTSGAFSLYMVLHGLLYIATGRLTDRFGPRIVMSVCGCFLGLGYLLMSQVNAAWHLYLVYGVLIAIGMSGAFVSLPSTIARWFVHKRGLMTGIIVSGVGIGTMVLPPVANWLISNQGWRSSYIIIGGVVFVFLLVAAQFLRHSPNTNSESKAETNTGGVSLSIAMRTRQFWMLCITWASFIFILMATMVHLVIYARGLGITPASAANVMVVIGGFSIIGRIAVGGLADKIGLKWTMPVCLVTLSLILFWLGAVEKTWVVYPFAAIFGFSYGGLSSNGSPMVAEFFGLRSHGAIWGIILFIGTIGGAIGPLVSGYIFDIRGSYQVAFFINASVVLAGAILMLLNRREV